MTSNSRHACHIAHVRIGDTVVRPDGSRATVTDAQHYRAPFAGRIADVRMSDGRRYNGVSIAGQVVVIAGPDHEHHSCQI